MKHPILKALALLGLFTLAACSDANNPNNQVLPNNNDPNNTADMGADQGLDAGTDMPVDVVDVSQRGEYGVGHLTAEFEYGMAARVLDVEIWYPAMASESTGDVLDFETGEQRTTYQSLLAASTECPSTQTQAARDATPAEGTWPVVVFSHCHACTRYSSFTIAEHLASWGFVVIAPDHEGNTLFDELRGDGEEVSPAFLEVRLADMKFMIDQITANSVPPPLIGKLDPDRIGVMGHSFGSVTAGYTAQEDDRVKSAVGIAAPMENPLLPGVKMTDINVPVLTFLATEDNSITNLGNKFLRDNYDDANAPAWLVEVEDAGHWTFSDLTALSDFLTPGCGDGERMTDGEPFTYVDLDTGRLIGATYATAFFRHTLMDEPAGMLGSAPPWTQVLIQSK